MLRINEETRVTIEVGSEDIHAIFPSYDDPQFGRGIEDLLRTRWDVRRGKPKDQSVQARTAFFRKYCRRVEGIGVVQDGAEVELCDAHPNDWMDKLSVAWISSWVAYFEERAALTEDEQGN